MEIMGLSFLYLGEIRGLEDEKYHSKRKAIKERKKEKKTKERKKERKN